MKIFQDVSKFMIIFCIVIIAFMVGLNNLYWYYEPNTRQQVELGLDGIFLPQNDTSEITAENNFGT